jgi:hypothetical protein
VCLGDYGDRLHSISINNRSHTGPCVEGLIPSKCLEARCVAGCAILVCISVL